MLGMPRGTQQPRGQSVRDQRTHLASLQSALCTHLMWRALLVELRVVCLSLCAVSWEEPVVHFWRLCGQRLFPAIPHFLSSCFGTLRNPLHWTRVRCHILVLGVDPHACCSMPVLVVCVCKWCTLRGV